MIEGLKSEDLVYGDESGIESNYCSNYGYSKIGKRCYYPKETYTKVRINMIGALNHKEFIAPFIFQGSCTTELFEAYVEKILLPELKPGQKYIIDNAAFHKSKKIHNLLQTKECELIFLPPYSPDLNPIEKFWHKLKSFIRKIKHQFKPNFSSAVGFAIQNVTTFD